MGYRTIIIDLEELKDIKSGLDFVYEEMSNITDIATQRTLSSSTTRSVSAELAPASAGFSSEPNTSAIAPITRALADNGTQSERMAECYGSRTPRGPPHAGNHPVRHRRPRS